MDRLTLARDALEAEAIRSNMERIGGEVEAACGRAGRDPETVEILAATKYISSDGMEALAEAGVTLVGENRAQELAAKHRDWGGSFTWDFIGHLQSNKVRQVLPLVRLIHSVETLSVVKELQRRADKPTSVLLQVNIGEEGSKCGIIPSEVDRFLEEASKFSMVNFTGLMTMPPLAADPNSSRAAFAALRNRADQLSRTWQGRFLFQQLSMGTSNDYIAAVEEGATIIRLGNVLYDKQESKG